jgi:hypothetical protein
VIEHALAHLRMASDQLVDANGSECQRRVLMLAVDGGGGHSRAFQLLQHATDVRLRLERGAFATAQLLKQRVGTHLQAGREEGRQQTPRARTESVSRNTGPEIIQTSPPPKPYITPHTVQA